MTTVSSTVTLNSKTYSVLWVGRDDYTRVLNLPREIRRTLAGTHRIATAPGNSDLSWRMILFIPFYDDVTGTLGSAADLKSAYETGVVSYTDNVDINEPWAGTRNVILLGKPIFHQFSSMPNPGYMVSVDVQEVLSA